MKNGYFQVKSFTKYKENQRISVYGAIWRKSKFKLVFFIGNMDSKNIEWVSEIITNIKENFED